MRKILRPFFSSQLGAGGDAVVENEDVQALLARFLVDGADDHTARVDAHHLARRQVRDGHQRATDQILRFVVGAECEASMSRSRLARSRAT